MWKTVDGLLQRAVEDGVFPGCAMAAGQGKHVLYTNACGHLVKDGVREVSHVTRYDVGELTRVLAAMPLCMVAVENGLVALDDTIDRFFKGVPSDKKDITLLHLLTHTSGLTPHFLLHEEAQNDQDVLAAVLKHPLAGSVGGKVRESAMGYLLLGMVLEKVFAMPLDEGVKRFVTVPLRMSHAGFLPSGEDVAPTAVPDENGEPQAGYPQDVNARFMHGVAGHAGLFVTLEDMTRYATMLACGGHSEGGVFLSQRSVHLATTERTRGMNEARGFGFHITKRANPFLGHLWPSDGYGLIDPASGSLLAVSTTDAFFVTLLLNASQPTCDAQTVRRISRLLLNAAYAAFQHELLPMGDY